MDKQILEQLIIRYLSNEASSEEQLQLFEWLAQNDEHQKIFHTYYNLWKSAEKPAPKFDAHQAFVRLNKKVDDHEKSLSSKRGISYFAIAASISLLIAATFFIHDILKEENTTIAVSYVERINTTGKPSTIILADGSSVTLNVNSKLRFAKEFESHQREVHLQGEAFFNIRRDSLRPFIVHTQQVKTQVLGTSFNIRESDSMVEVSVASGKVSVTKGNNRALLLPNNKVIIDFDKSQWHKKYTDLEEELAWKDNTLIFKDQPMKEVITKLQNWYGVTFKITNSQFLECRVTGKFKNESLENILTAIAYSIDLEFHISKKVITLNGRACD